MQIYLLIFMSLITSISNTFITVNSNNYFPPKGAFDLNVDLEPAPNDFDTLYVLGGYLGVDENACDNNVISFYNDRNHSVFGHITYYSSAVLVEEKQTYQSGWFPNDQHFSDINAMKSYTFRFDEFYVDIPVEILYTRNIPAKTGIHFTSQFTSAHSEYQSITTNYAMEILSDFTLDSGYEIGASIPIEFIKLNLSRYINGTIGLNASLYQEIEKINSSYSYFSSVLSETYNIENEYNFPIYVQLNYRQKFNLFFTYNAKYDYSVEEIKSGSIFLDTTWQYNLAQMLFDSIHFFLIPEDDPYFDVSIYYDNADGVKTILEKSHPSILYF